MRVWSGVGLQVGGRAGSDLGGWRQHDYRANDVGLRAKDVDAGIAFTLEVGPDVPQIGDLPPDHGRTDRPPPRCVAREADLGRQGEDEGDDRSPGVTSEVDGRGPTEPVGIGRIDDGQEPGLESVPDRLVEEVERRIGDSLVRLISGEQPSKTVRGKDRPVREVPPRERRLSGSGRPDQEDHGIRRYADRAPRGQDRFSHGRMIP